MPAPAYKTAATLSQTKYIPLFTLSCHSPVYCDANHPRVDVQESQSERNPCRMCRPRVLPFWHFLKGHGFSRAITDRKTKYPLILSEAWVPHPRRVFVFAARVGGARYQ